MIVNKKNRKYRNDQCHAPTKKQLPIPLRFLKAEEIAVLYPNKFIALEEKRIYVYNTLFNLPEIYLLAAIIDYFAKHKEYKEIKVFCTCYMK